MEIYEATEQAYKNGYEKAVKEFVKKLESKLANNMDISCIGYQSVIGDIDSIVKEMVGKNG